MTKEAPTPTDHHAEIFLMNVAGPAGEFKPETEVVPLADAIDQLRGASPPLTDEELVEHLRRPGTLTWRQCHGMAESLREQGVVAYSRKHLEGGSNGQ